MRASNQPEVVSAVFNSMSQVYDQDYRGVAIPHFYESVSRVPLVRLPASDVTLKLENRQRTGAFKQRGAFVAGALALRDNPEITTVTTNSAGNHALGVAAFTQWHNLNRKDGPALEPYIYMASTASFAKKARLRKLGAVIIDSFDSLEEAGTAAVAHAEDNLYAHFIHPFQDPNVIAGQSTSFAETVADLEASGLLNPTMPLDTYAGCGGMGEALGLASLLHIYKQQGRVHEDSQVIAVQEHYTDAMARRIALDSRSMPVPNDLFIDRAGTDQFHTQNDGTAVRTPSEDNVARAHWHIEHGNLRLLQVPSSMVGRAIAEGLTMKEIIEPAGALGYAGLLYEEEQQRVHSFSSDSRLKTAMVTGGNLTEQTRQYYMQEFWNSQAKRSEFMGGYSIQHTVAFAQDPYAAVLERAGIPAA